MGRTKSALLLCLFFVTSLPSTAPAFPSANPDRNRKDGPARLFRERYNALELEGRGGPQPEAPSPGSGHVRPGTEIRYEPRLGLPTFLWAGERGRLTAVARAGGVISPADAARIHLEAYAPLYHLEPADLSGLKIRSVHDTGRGARIVAFSQVVDGVDVFRDEMRLALDRRGDLIALSGYLTSPVRRERAFALRAEEAVAAALADLTRHPFAGGDLRPAGLPPRAGFHLYSLDQSAQAASGIVESALQGARRVWFRLPDGLEPAWNVIVRLGTPEGVESASYGYVVAATDSRILHRMSFTLSDAYAYRVWADPNDLIPFDGPEGNDPTPHPTGFPDGFHAPSVPSHLITLASTPISTGDPWLPPAATESVGNNVDAYADIASPDGFSAGDLRATTTSTGVFDRTYDTAVEPTAITQQLAAITQLFYANNWLHDWFYDAGFDEASGNAQADNYGRGGVAGDVLLAEGQDYSGRNNADMTILPDGFSPIMQIYITDGPETLSVEINSPPAIAGTIPAAGADFGLRSFVRTRDVVLVDDGAGVTTDGCTIPFVNGDFLPGRIALIDAGNCSFILKVQNAEIYGSAGVLIANDTAGLTTMQGTGVVEIPSLMITQADGAAIKANLGAGVNVRMLRQSGLDLDATIDNQTVAHEWGHYISYRLVGNVGGLDTLQGVALSEGWGDFIALFMTVRPEDANQAANASFSGVYALYPYAAEPWRIDPYYFGIRRAPYSTDFAKNPLTFRHIEDGVPLPTTAPLAFGQSGTFNSEVHRTGEIWANMLWECYAALLRDTLGSSPRLSFAEAQQRMKDYLVASLKMTPNSPTFLDARDALLSVAAANDPLDLGLFWQAFAKRGAGVGAVAPDTFSDDNSGVVESYALGGDLVLESLSLADDVATQCLPDGDLDEAETGSLAVTLRNSGSAMLGATAGAVVSTNPDVFFPSGHAIVFPTSAPFGTTTASVPIILSGAAAIEEAVFQIEFDDSGLVVPGPITASGSFRVNSDDLPAQSATDDVESDNSLWTAANDPAAGGSHSWERVAVNVFDHRWHGPDTTGVTDVWLISPTLPAAPTGSFGFTFRHRHDFQKGSGATFFDCGVMEISADGGATWSDIGGFASPGYNNTVIPGGGNPLDGRQAWVGRNPSYPAFNTVTVSLGTAYQGQTVRIRFRIGTDLYAGAPGWEIDDIAFTNITSTPFPVLVTHDPTCDADVDGTFDAADCAPANGTLWSKPSAVLDLEAGGGTTTLFTWHAPAIPGGSGAVTYDLLRSDGAIFGGATCLGANMASTSSMDAGIPSSAFYYLLGARNGCGRTIAPDSDGVARTAPACTP